MQEGHILPRLLRLPPTIRPFFKGQNNQKLCLFFCHSLVCQIILFYIIYCTFDQVFDQAFHPQTFTVYQDIVISLTIKFLAEFLSFSGHNSIIDHTGGLFYIA